MISVVTATLTLIFAELVSIYVNPFTVDIGISHEVASHVFSETVLQRTINKHS